jgi:hypothetical protein
MGKPFLKILESEVEVVAAWLLMLLLYSILLYLVRHIKRS